jgi:ubiquinone/menaquinone biosynthesis C-methylase UbiE
VGLYHDHILPHVIYLCCGRADVTDIRRSVVPEAYGRVLEIGMGAGANLPLYDPAKVDVVLGLEPSEGMRRKAAPAIAASPVPVELIDAGAESIPLPDASVDTVVLTYTLCSIPDAERALAEMRRVLKPGGLMLFAEHGRDPDPGIYKWQRRIEPVWKPVFGGCHLTRDAPALLEHAGFRIQRRDSVHLTGMPKFGAFQTMGAAR